MVYPNAYCVGFCYWMLNVSWQVLTPSRLALITTVYNAGVAGSTVSALQYNNFTQITSWRKPYYDAYLTSNTPYSVIPVGTCDFWFSSQYLKYNQTNNAGIVRFSGPIQKISDLNGGTVFGSNANFNREPLLVYNPLNIGSQQFFGFNATALSFFNLTNAGALIQNKGAYTLFLAGNFAGGSTNPYGFYFGAGANVAKARMGIFVNGSGNWTATGLRLDADAQVNLSGSAASSTFAIVCFTMDWSTGAGKLYINGTLTASNNALTTAGNTSNTASSAVSIGTLNSAQIWNGLISDVLGFQTALSAVNVASISSWLNGMRKFY